MSAWRDTPGITIGMYGDLQIPIASIQTVNDRTTDVQKYRDRDGARVEDRKREPYIVEVTLRFVGTSLTDECRAFLELANCGKTQRLIHPLLGDVPVKFQRATPAMNSEGREIVVAATFIESNCDDISAEVPGESMAGIDSVATTALRVSETLGRVFAGVDTLDVEAAKATAAITAERVSAWPSMDPTAALAESSWLTAEIDAVLAELQNQSVIGCTDAEFEWLRLREEVRQTAVEFLSDRASRTIDVHRSTSLLGLAQELFGIADLDIRAEQIAKLNPDQDPLNLQGPIRVPV